MLHDTWHRLVNVTNLDADDPAAAPGWKNAALLSKLVVTVHVKLAPTPGDVQHCSCCVAPPTDVTDAAS